MFFKRFYDEDLAQGSYLIGCQKTGEAVVVDARRDIGIYLEEAAKRNLRITAVTETHIHADYLSGSRELAAATGATLYLSDEGDADWKYGFEGVKLYDGSEIKLGNIIIRAVHTPGHTPEHLSFLVTDGATTDQPGFMLTGDFVFVGDLGRPDLLDEAAGGIDTRFVGAKQLFHSLKEKFLTLPDYVQVWPAHGAGSACGKSLGAVASSTVGYERLFSWWASYLEADDEAGFTEALLQGQPDAPSYFGRMKRQNKEGPALLGSRPGLKAYAPEEVKAAQNAGSTLVDVRPRESFAQAAVPGSLHIPAGKNFVTWAAWLIDPEKDAPIILLGADEAQALELRDALSRVGIDKMVGYAGLEGLELTPQKPERLEAIATLSDPFILDVRTINEYNEGHLPEAKQIHGGRILKRLDDIPQDRPVVVHCQSGARSAAAASLLRSVGYSDVHELEGGYDAWAEAQKSEALV